MKKGLTYLLALGCVSSCLLSVAYADERPGRVKFLIKPDLDNIACNGRFRHADYVIRNNDDDNVILKAIRIHTDWIKDSFPGNDEVVHLGGYDTQDIPTPGFCQQGMNLHPNQTCTVRVNIDPQAIDCEDTLISDGEIERELVVVLNNHQRQIHAPIDFDVTIVGAADGFALMGGQITNHDAGPANVSQDVACTRHSCDPSQISNINFNDGAQLRGPLDPKTLNAVSDFTAGYNHIKHLYQHNCTRISPNLGHHQTIPSGVYCFKDPAPVVVSGLLKFSGEGDHIFIIDFEDAYPDDITLDIQKGARFEFVDSEKGERSDPGVYWLVDGAVEVDRNSEFAGTIISTYNFESEEKGVGALLRGRVLLLPQSRSIIPESEEPGFGEIALHGNLIENPNSDHHKKDL